MKPTSFITLLVSIVVLTSCGVRRQTPTVQRPAPINISYEVLRQPRVNAFINMDYGIRVQTYDTRNKKTIVSQYDANPIFSPEVNTYPTTMEFLRESITSYMKTLGFTINSDIETDYLMSVKLTEMNLSYISNIGWVSDITLNIDVVDNSHKMIYPNVVVKGRSNRFSSAQDYATATFVVNDAYTNALENIDWDRIVYFLKKAEKPSEEKNKKVTGSGNTALESTVVYWNIESSPRGADVYWRVVSSTPNVKDTNSKYLGSTPFESTETFDIIGLTYNNSGNVQIEVTCEKAGYVPQKKRFNLRSIIDQKEVSTKFNLIKEE